MVAIATATVACSMDSVVSPAIEQCSFTKHGIFTTVVNIMEFVNELKCIANDIRGSGINLRYEAGADRLFVTNHSGQTTSLKLVRLYRPSSDDVVNNAAQDTLLVIASASDKAARAAFPHNHILLPKGSLRIIAPGVALVHDAGPSSEMTESRQVRLTGRTGVVVESLLLNHRKDWSVRQLAEASHVSPALAQRVVNRLEHEALLTSSGAGRDKTRAANNPRALAELWSHEEKMIKPALRGFLYGASPETVAQRVLDLYAGGAVGGVVAANFYVPTLTRVPAPIRVWLPDDFDRSVIYAEGFTETDEGANVELVTLAHNPWLVHANLEGISRVSPWRAWVEIAQSRGRVQELADGLLQRLQEQQYGSD